MGGKQNKRKQTYKAVKSHHIDVLTQPNPNAEAYLRRIKITNASSCGVSFFLHLRAIVKEKVIPPGRTGCKRENSLSPENRFSNTLPVALREARWRWTTTNQSDRFRGASDPETPERNKTQQPQRCCWSETWNLNFSIAWSPGFCHHSQGASYMRPLKLLVTPFSSCFQTQATAVTDPQ